MSLVSKIQSIINKANQTTGKQDKDLTTAVSSLVSGYGSGGGTDTSDATAVADDVFKGKTFYAKGQKVTGTVTEWKNGTGYSKRPCKDYGKELMITHTMGGNYTIRKGSEIWVSTLLSNLGNATATDVAAGKTFTSADGFKVTGIATSSGGIDTSDATATENDIESGKTAYVNGKKIIGNIKAVGRIGDTSISSPIPNIAETSLKNSSSSNGPLTHLNLKMDATKKTILNNNSNVYVNIPRNLLGTATAADVRKGKTFCGADGANRTGTAEFSGGGNNNCEAYSINVSSPVAHFKSTGTIKAWGYGESGTGFQIKKYAFKGDKYQTISYGGTETALNLSVDSSGNITGLPSMTSGTIILTIGI